MQTTFKQQIEAIGIAMSTEDVRNLPQSIRLALNDAASTIASLNLAPPQSLEKEIENQFPSNDVIITVEKLYTEE